MDSPTHLLKKANPFACLRDSLRIKNFYGGRGSGKSFTVTDALILIANTYNVTILCARELQNSLGDSVLGLLWHHVERRGLTNRFKKTKNEIRNRFTGARFIFKGLRTNVSEIKSMHGIDICFIEEAQSVSKESFQTLLPTIRDAGSEIWLCGNPLMEDDYYYQRFVINIAEGEVAVKVNWNDNPSFSAALEHERQHALMLIATAPNDDARAQAQADYDWIWEGHCKRISAQQVIRRWEVKDFETPDDVELYYGMDFGFSTDPNALIRGFVIDGDIYVDQELIGHGIEIKEIPTWMKAMPGAQHWRIRGDCSRPETISHIANDPLGFDIVPCVKGEGSVEDGLSWLNSHHRIYIHPRCEQMLFECKNYKYKVDKQTGEVLPLLIDKHNHCTDALRYAFEPLIKNEDKGFFDKSFW